MIRNAQLTEKSGKGAENEETKKTRVTFLQRHDIAQR